MRPRRRARAERELGVLRAELAQLRAEHEVASGHAAWMSLSEDPLERLEGAEWGRQSASLAGAIDELEQRVFLLQVKLA